MSLTIGRDGRARCAWAGADPEYVRYHDDEWGRRIAGDRAYFERICLEGFQAGLSWLTILRRRAGFRAAFDDFDPSRIAEYTADDAARLLTDTRIIRNRAKIDATIGNARALLAMHAADGDGALERLVLDVAGPRGDRPRPRRAEEVPAVTPESTELSRALKRRSFRFVGPTTMYALMQATGLVDDHIAGCWRADDPS